MRHIAIHFYLGDKYYKEYEKIHDDFINSLNEFCKVDMKNMAVFEHDDWDEELTRGIDE